MARINVGVNPKYISDQHLNAEYVEIQMVMAFYRSRKFMSKTPIPEKYTLGKGHINFFRNKLWYLTRRLNEVRIELMNRGFDIRVNGIDLEGVPLEFINDWDPKLEDSIIVRRRIADRLHNPLKANANFHRYYRKPISELNTFTDNLINSELYHV